MTGVELEKRTPQACGALGCQETDDLRQVTNGGVTRMLCPSCASRFVEEATA